LRAATQSPRSTGAFNAKNDNRVSGMFHARHKRNRKNPSRRTESPVAFAANSTHPVFAAHTIGAMATREVAAGFQAGARQHALESQDTLARTRRQS